ncbi:MAG: ATP-binding protein [Acidobacteriota bacterium]
MDPKPWLQIRRSGNDTWKITLIVVLTLVISAFHFMTGTEHRYLHEIYQRTYYIPILLAAFWYGPVIGVAAAFGVSAIYWIHIRLDWMHAPVYSFNQYAEIILYHAVALIIGILAFRERTQRRRLEATSNELAEAYQKLQTTFEQLRRADRLAALGQLSAGIAHEIRNPLGSIKGSIEILESEIPDSHPKHEFIEIIKEETARLNRLVGEFLEFARPARPTVAAASLNDLIESARSLVAQKAERSGIVVSTDLDPSIPPLALDSDQIRQVLLNVLINAVQAMSDGGRLSICSRYRKGAARAVIEISDTGPGMPPEQIEHIFDPFFSTKPEGTGLGLSISHQLVENHGGRITARANSGPGLTLRIELPA